MKRFFVSIIISSVFFVLFLRLVYLQLFYEISPGLIQDETIEAIYINPERGYIFDRNNKLLVANQLSYDAMIIPREMRAFDTIQLCKLLKITKQEFLDKYNKAVKYSPIKPSILVSQLSKNEYAYLKEKIRNFKGLNIKKNSQRYYPNKIAANVLGYVSEVTPRELRKKKYYQLGEAIGRQGVEKQYENVLRGRKGINYIQKDRFNRHIGSYRGGIYDTLPIQGKDLQLTLDKELQEYGELLMKNKRGGIVAIEPNTGEILALVSSPSYDPSLLVGRKRSENYTKLYNDSIAKPLYDRGLLALYPPGSTFKPINALIGLQEGVIDYKSQVTCHSGYRYGRGAFVKCHCKYGTKNDLSSAIYNSCNSYFSTLYRKTIEKYSSPAEGIDNWKNRVESFGLGDYLGYDLPIGKSGSVPSSVLYNGFYGKDRWKSTFTISNAIGQGEILVTPIQMANVSAIIANKGYYYTPHIVKKIGTEAIKNKKYISRKYTNIDSIHYNHVVEGMVEVYKKGTARWLQLKNINIAGKTGTSENFTKIKGKRVQLTDHSIFMAFAPVENPKIAIVVFVENGFWGSRFAGPIATLCIDKYLNPEITRKDLEQRMLNKSLEEEYLKPLSGKPFRINTDD